MAVTQYIGSRYVPLFADPIDWDITRAYEPLTIVYYQGNSYTSKQSVPTGIDVTNETYWAITGNYNAQVEQYRREVQTFDGRITANAQAIADEVTARMAEDTTIRGLISDLQTDLTAEESARESADTQLRTDFTAADTQLRTDFTAADTAINGRIDAATSRITTVEGKVSVLEDPYIAIVGDSFSDGSSEWPGILAANSGYKILNGAVAASTFGSNAQGKQFIQQLTELSQNANWNKVTHLIVYGGINDWTDLNASASQTNNFINSFINAYNDLTHKPKITFVMGNCGAPDRNFSRTYLGYPTYINELISNIKEKGFAAIPAYAWLLGYANSEVFNSDNLHPSALGQHIIASFMQSVVEGTYNGFIRQLTSSTPTDSNFTGKAVINVYDTYVMSVFQAFATNAFTSADTNYHGLFSFGKRFWFGRNEGTAGVAKLKLLVEDMNSFTNMNIRTFSNTAVGFLGYHIAQTGVSISSGYTFAAPPNILPFE